MSKLKAVKKTVDKNWNESQYVRDRLGKFASKSDNTETLTTKKEIFKGAITKTVQKNKSKRLSSNNRKADTDRLSVLNKTKQWESSYKDIENVIDLENIKESSKELKSRIETAKKRNLSTVDIGDSPVTDQMIKENKQYHKQNFKININDEGGTTAYRSNYDGKRLGYIEKQGEMYATYNKTSSIKEPLFFKTKESADKYLKDVVQAYTETNIFPLDKAENIKSYSNSEIRRLSKVVRESGYGKTKIDDLIDNKGIGETIIEEGLKKRSKLIGITDNQGNLQSAAKYNLQSDHLHIDYLATAPWNFKDNDEKAIKGAGAATIAELVKLSIKSGKKGKIKLTALDGAIPFYKHLGFKEVDRGINEYSLSTQEAQKLLEKYG